jgi:hypothetical protein
MKAQYVHVCNAKLNPLDYQYMLLRNEGQEGKTGPFLRYIAVWGEA